MFTKDIIQASSKDQNKTHMFCYPSYGPSQDGYLQEEIFSKKSSVFEYISVALGETTQV